MVLSAQRALDRRSTSPLDFNMIWEPEAEARPGLRRTLCMGTYSAPRVGVGRTGTPGVVVAPPERIMLSVVFAQIFFERTCSLSYKNKLIDFALIERVKSLQVLREQAGVVCYASSLRYSPEGARINRSPHGYEGNQGP